VVKREFAAAAPPRLTCELHFSFPLNTPSSYSKCDVLQYLAHPAAHKMRLRLRIHRNELPPVSTLWPINDTHLKHTITQLLAQIDQVFPLEGYHWGLEHYTVTLEGYELLHYHELGAVCKDEDEVVIRPMMWAETRARRLGGRDQITADGRHLVDGCRLGGRD